VDDITKREIDNAVRKVLREAGLQPPINAEQLLKYLDVNRIYYDLDDPNLLKRFWHKIRIGQNKIASLARKIKLAALWLPDEDQIIVDSSLPKPKKEWASFHDATHTILKWHRHFFLGDTAQTLDPDFQEMLESEANYGASALMFGGNLFTKEALDTKPNWESVKSLQKRYKKSFVVTLRRYIEFSHKIPMAMIVSTPWWMEIPNDQNNRCRHFIASDTFKNKFGKINPTDILNIIDAHTTKRRGGIVANFEMDLIDLNGDRHTFYSESFFNRHYILTLIVCHDN